MPRTVRCSHCFQSGHNKMGCSDYKQRIEELRALYGDEYYTVREYDRKKNNKRESSKTRKCSYCGQTGHNRAGCEKLKSAIAAYSARNAEYRANVISALVEWGLGPGAMIQWDDYWGSKKTALIVGIQWDKINMSVPLESFLEVTDVKELNSKYRQAMQLPLHLTGRTYGADYATVVATTESKIKQSIPAGFLDGSLGVKALFKDKKSHLHTMRDNWGDFDNEFDATIYKTSVRND